MSAKKSSHRAKGPQLEHQLLGWLAIAFIPPLGMGVFIAWYFQLEALTVFTLVAALVCCHLLIVYKIYYRVMDVLSRLSLQLDALGHEEYTSWNLGNYRRGILGEMRRDFQRTTLNLASRKQQYIENELFIFNFIDLIQLPVAVLDNRQCLFHANQALEHCLGKPWQSFSGQPASDFGLEQSDSQWQFSDPQHPGQFRWQLQSSVLKRGQQHYQLIVFISIEKALRANELKAWQNIIRVLNHEVRNSLTPIYSMTQSLKEMHQLPSLSPQQQQMQHNILDVIEKRSEHLLTFVESYSALSSLPPAKLQPVDADELAETLTALYPQLHINNLLKVPLYADRIQLEQALINLIRNAFEALQGRNDGEVCLDFSQQGQQLQITLSDNGSGISNPDNLFVPFYSTKQGGSGIGLVLSRELLRNQGGELTLSNRQDNAGAIARLLMPVTPLQR